MRRDNRHVTGRQRETARTLRAIGEQQPPGLVDDTTNGGEVLTIAGFGIDLLHRHQRAFALDRLGQHFEIERAVGPHRQAFCGRDGLQHAVMFDRGHHARTSLRMAQRQRRRLACARSEDHLAVPAERRLHPLARIFEQAARLAPGGMRAARIGPEREAILHRLQRFGAQRRGGGMVEIDGRGNGGCSKILRNGC